MPLDIAVYTIAEHKRSEVCSRAMYAGIKAAGDRARLFVEADYREPFHDVAVFYGYTPTMRRIAQGYAEAGRPWVYIDLGYWGREGMNGFHKVSVNDRHPTAYFMRKRHGDSRARALGLTVSPWRSGGKHILLAGMGEKAAEAEGKVAEHWERDAVKTLHYLTSRPIIYRPKPSWVRAKPLPGTVFSWGGPKEQPGFPRQHLNQVFKDCHAVVTHHSNVAVEAIVAGIPAFCWKGVAVPMSSQDLREIEAPREPHDRQQFLNCVTYCQWSIAEMNAGLAWRHLQDEGLI